MRGFKAWYDNRADDLTKEGMLKGIEEAAAFVLARLATPQHSQAVATAAGSVPVLLEALERGNGELQLAVAAGPSGGGALGPEPPPAAQPADPPPANPTQPAGPAIGQAAG